ncbi:hypothetical protein ACFQZ8_24500, partial [Micromonospora azadirachtae]
REERELRLRLSREDAAARRRAERERVNRRRIDILLGVATAVGLSGVMQLIQAGYDLTDLWALSLAIGVLITAALFGFALHFVLRDRRGSATDSAAGSLDDAGSVTG